jgi:amphi-Trp domain-containing protein
MGGAAVSDVKVERKESVSREDAARWLELASRAFAAGSDVDLPFGAGEVSLHIPDQVQAEFEIEVDGTEVEVELEFKWSTAGPGADVPKDAKEAPQDRPRRPSGTRQSAKSRRPAKR